MPPGSFGVVGCPGRMVALMKKAVALLIIFGIAAAAAEEYLQVRDRLSAERDAIGREWTRMDNDLKKRAELIPELARAARQIPSDGQRLADSIEEAAGAINKATIPSEGIAANAQLNSAIGRLMLAFEIRAQSGGAAKQLLFQLAERENRIFQSRRRYNDAVKDYNVTLSQFPANLVGAIASFVRDDNYFKTDITGHDLP